MIAYEMISVLFQFYMIIIQVVTLVIVLCKKK